MDEGLLVYGILSYAELGSEEDYLNYLHTLFLKHPEDWNLLHLEWETDIKKAVDYMRTNILEKEVNWEQFGRMLVEELEKIYENSDLEWFADRTYRLWKNLPEQIQDIEPFWTLNGADEPLSWGDAAQTRALYETIFHYYET